MQVQYERSRKSSIAFLVEEEILQKFGDGRPFRWRDVRDAYKRAWSKVNKKKVTFEPTLGTNSFMRETPWIVHHMESDVPYELGGHFYWSYGIWRSVIPLEQFHDCLMWEKRGEIQKNNGVYYYPDPSSPQCRCCDKLHPNPFNVKPLGRHEVF